LLIGLTFAAPAGASLSRRDSRLGAVPVPPADAAAASHHGAGVNTRHEGTLIRVLLRNGISGQLP
jgi:hypothetical protein